MKFGAKARAAAVLVALIAYVGFASTWVVQQNEAGVRVRFGRPLGTVGGGLHFTLPYPIEQVVSIPTTEVRSVAIGVELEGDTSTFNSRILDDRAQWLTGDTNIVELRANVLYTVTDPIAYYIGFAESADGTTREHLIRGASEAVLTRLLAGMTIDSVLAQGKVELSRNGLRDIQVLLDELNAGVRLSALNIAEVNPPETVIAAFNDVSSATADRERYMTEAEGLRGTVLPRAKAKAREAIQSARTYANDLTSRARGDADSFLELAKEVSNSPRSSRDRLWLESVERILAASREEIVPPGSRVYIKR